MINYTEPCSTVLQPALVLLYGTPGSSPPRCPLDRDATLVGKSRGCDLCLSAPDVSSIHCVITRGAGAWSIRDCASRAGTRLNGEPVEEASLHDGDLIQLGPFSLRVLLPPQRKAGPGQPSEPRHLRLERKRRNLIHLALAQRRRLRELQKALTSGLPARAVLDLSAKASGLRQRLRAFQQRLLKLEQGERDLSRDRDILAQEQRAFRDRVQALEAELGRRRTELDHEVARRVQEQAESIM